jgi:transcriptional regulator of acetoin/glycerol metabolism
MHNLLRTAVALLGERKEILIDDLVEDFLAQADLAAGAETDTVHDCGGTSLVDLEARHIAATLDRTGGNVSAAARQLGMGRTTLYRKLRSLPSPDGPSTAPGC